MMISSHQALALLVLLVIGLLLVGASFIPGPDDGGFSIPRWARVTLAIAGAVFIFPSLFRIYVFAVLG